MECWTWRRLEQGQGPRRFCWHRHWAPSRRQLSPRSRTAARSKAPAPASPVTMRHFLRSKQTRRNQASTHRRATRIRFLRKKPEPPRSLRIFAAVAEFHQPRACFERRAPIPLLDGPTEFRTIRVDRSNGTSSDDEFVQSAATWAVCR